MTAPAFKKRQLFDRNMIFNTHTHTHTRIITMQIIETKNIYNFEFVIKNSKQKIQTRYLKY